MHRIELPPDAEPFASLDELVTRLKPAPIERSWILSGNPQARSATHSHSADRAASTVVWDCTAGAFNWRFSREETVLILEGSVRVTSPQAKTMTLNIGDVGYFAGGTVWRWEVDHYVRKIAFTRRPVSYSERVMRAIEKRLLSHRMAVKLGLGLITAAALALYALD